MLVNCVAYQDGKKLADITKHQISDYVGRPDCFVWVALKDPEDAERGPGAGMDMSEKVELARPL